MDIEIAKYFLDWFGANLLLILVFMIFLIPIMAMVVVGLGIYFGGKLLIGRKK